MVIKPALATAVVGDLMVTAFAVVPPTEAHIRKVAPAVIAAPLLILGEALTPIAVIRKPKIVLRVLVRREKRKKKPVIRMALKLMFAIAPVRVGLNLAGVIVVPSQVIRLLAVAVIPVVLNTLGIRPLVLMIATLPVVARIAIVPPSPLRLNLAVVRMAVRRPEVLLVTTALG